MSENRDADFSALEDVIRLHGVLRRQLEPVHVTPLQAAVLLYVQRHTGTRVMRMAKDLKLQPPTMVNVVQDLVVKKLIAKKGYAFDRRVKPLFLTSRGQSTVRQVTRKINPARLNKSSGPPFWFYF